MPSRVLLVGDHVTRGWEINKVIRSLYAIRCSLPIIIQLGASYHGAWMSRAEQFPPGGGVYIH